MHFQTLRWHCLWSRCSCLRRSWVRWRKAWSKSMISPISWPSLMSICPWRTHVLWNISTADGRCCRYVSLDFTSSRSFSLFCSHMSNISWHSFKLDFFFVCVNIWTFEFEFYYGVNLLIRNADNYVIAIFFSNNYSCHGCKRFPNSPIIHPSNRCYVNKNHQASIVEESGKILLDFILFVSESKWHFILKYCHVIFKWRE